MVDIKALLSQVDTVLFDMDGTIVNTEPLHAKAAMLVLNDLGIAIDLEACIEKYYGMTDTTVLKLACPQMSDLEIEDAITKKNQHLINIFHKLPQSEKINYITPGFFEFLNLLKFERKNTAVISASEDIVVEHTLRCFEIDRLIDLRMGRGQTELTKPHPEPYLEGMRRLNTHSSRTLIFEDSPTGLEAAVASGATVVRITGFAHNNKVLHTHEVENFLF
jgi:beta-phosphoglucomutase